MNVLPIEKQVQVVNALVEGCSVRATARLAGVEHKTVLRVLLRAGEHCQGLLDERVRNVRAQFVQVDEIHGYVQVRQKNLRPGKHDESAMGEQYLFVAMDSASKLVLSFLVGKRNAENAYRLMKDLESRLATRTQLTTDGFKPYVNAVDGAFGSNVDYAMLVKVFQGDEENRERYSPSEIVEAVPVRIMGSPRPEQISTSHIERQNLTIRMQMRRFTRLTNAFSKKLENMKAACALHFAHYNFCRPHSSLRITPSMQAGITGHVWTVEELLGLPEAGKRRAA